MFALWATAAVIFFPVMLFLVIARNFKAIVTFIVLGFLSLFAFKYTVIALAYVLTNPIPVLIAIAVIAVILIVVVSDAVQQPGYQPRATSQPIYEAPSQTYDQFMAAVQSHSNQAAAKDYANRHRFMAINPEWYDAFAEYERTGFLDRPWPHSYDALVAIENWYTDNPHLAHVTPNRSGLYYDSHNQQYCFTG